MDYQAIIDILIKLLAALLIAGLNWLWIKAQGLISKWKESLKLKMDIDDYNYLMEQIEKFTAAAEQQFKSEDPTGEIRNNYVKEQLTSLGYEVTDLINAYIEAAVREINVTTNN